METDLYIDNIIQKINTIREQQFLINDFVYIEKDLPKKTVNENSMEFKNFQSAMKTKSSQAKIKKSGIKKKEYDTTNGDINIISDDIFKMEEIAEDLAEKLDIQTLNKEDKLKLIHNFIQKKCITLSQEDLDKIDQIIDNPDISLRKYINVSKMYQEINKISFIKKLEDGTYIVDLEENKPKKTKKTFFK